MKDEDDDEEDEDDEDGETYVAISIWLRGAHNFTQLCRGCNSRSPFGFRRRKFNMPIRSTILGH